MKERLEKSVKGESRSERIACKPVHGGHRSVTAEKQDMWVIVIKDMGIFLSFFSRMGNRSM